MVRMPNGRVWKCGNRYDLAPHLQFLPTFLVVALLGACGGGSSVEVPVGLTVHCARLRGR
jgi:hypothetical protein